MLPEGGNSLPSDTKAALLYLKNLFPTEKFEGRLPPIVVKHQLYSIVKNRTIVDKELVSILLHMLSTYSSNNSRLVME